MTDDIVIRIANLSKCYPIFDKPQHRLWQALSRNRKWRGKEFWALKDVSFEIKRGESIGIIGRNGSGKSTLLQIIAGILTPTSGEAEVHGRVAALLELGSGFDPEFTGRENVYINGAVMGLSCKEIDLKFDGIADFADIGDFMDQPVKEYSSGMMMRLAFAVQVTAEPEILIVDEALSVGDFFFQQKCLKKIRELQAQGTTLLFVSHDMGVVRDLCSKGLYLKNGLVAFWGQNLAAIRGYLSEGDGNSSATDIVDNTAVEKVGEQDVSALLEGAIWSNPIPVKQPDQKAEILAVGVYDEDGESTMVAKMGTDVIFRILFRTYTDEPVHVTVAIKNKFDQIVTATGSYTLDTELPRLQRGEAAIFELRTTLMLEAGLYTFWVNVGYPGSGTNAGVVLHETPWLGPLRIVWDYENNKAPFLGMFGIPVDGAFVGLNKE